jgi:hypothetical protein
MFCSHSEVQERSDHGQSAPGYEETETIRFHVPHYARIPLPNDPHVLFLFDHLGGQTMKILTVLRVAACATCIASASAASTITNAFTSF